MKIGFYTLGCKVNQYETQAMEQILAAQGHQVCTHKDACDAYIINTCSVTAVADKKNRAVIRRIQRDFPDAVLAVCGCYPQHASAALEKMGIDVIGGSAQRQEFLQKVLDAVQTKQKATVLDAALRRREFEVLPAGGLEGRTRAMLKVQDGCVNFCSYCIIPYTRGPVRSAPLELAVEQAKELAQQGDCVIVGRCADYVLSSEEDVDVVSVFLYSPMDFRTLRVAESMNLTTNRAKDYIQKTHKQRRTYYDYYTSHEWGKMQNYDICINTQKTGIEKAAEMVVNYLK